jgi:crotonobetaine/carnitine-CoA ligase
VIGGLGHLMRMLWDSPERAANSENPVRVALIATPPRELRAEFAAHFGVKLVDSYGMTEAEPVTVPVPSMDLPAGSCGIENEDFEVAILDGDGHRVSAGSRGEIAIRPRVPDVMFRGYERDEAATVASWKDLWFHTGDWGQRDEQGYLYLVDRRKDVIRRKGESVSPSEVEGIVRSHPAVADCAVVGIAEADDEEEVKLFVVATETEAPTPEELHDFCRERMARFMVPRYVEIVAELPYSEIGKVDRRSLKEAGSAGWDAANPSGPRSAAGV